MILTVHGTKEKDIIKKITDASNLFASILMSKQMIDKLCVDVHLSLNNCLDGECSIEDDLKYPKNFAIYLKKQKDNEMIKTLAHEFVHIKQYAKRELIDNGICKISLSGTSVGAEFDFDIKWQGKKWKPKKDDSYHHDSPWEIEAYGREVGMYLKWYNMFYKKEKQ